MEINIDDVIKAYVTTRDQIDAMEASQKVALAPLRERLQKIERWLQNQLQSQGLQNVKGSAGTAFLQGVSSVKTQDRGALFQFCKDKEAWDLLDGRVSKSAVEDFVQTFGEAPPGVEIRRETVVRVRRG